MIHTCIYICIYTHTLKYRKVLFLSVIFTCFSKSILLIEFFITKQCFGMKLGIFLPENLIQQ